MLLLCITIPQATRRVFARPSDPLAGIVFEVRIHNICICMNSSLVCILKVRSPPCSSPTLSPIPPPHSSPSLSPTFAPSPGPPSTRRGTVGSTAMCSCTDHLALGKPCLPRWDGQYESQPNRLPISFTETPDTVTPSCHVTVSCCRVLPVTLAWTTLS